MSSRPSAPKSSETALWRPSRDEVSGLVEWSAFFAAWGFRGHWPAIADDPEQRDEALKLFRDAQDELARLEPDIRCVAAVLPANAVGEDVEIYGSEARDAVRERLCFLRMQRVRADGGPLYSLSDFVAPKSSGIPDWIGLFEVSVFGGTEAAAEARSRGDEYSALLRQLLFDRLAEAAAEWTHRKTMSDLWGIGDGGPAVGIRPAPGYPACPDHTEKAKIWSLLEVERNVGAKLTENYAISPVSSVCGLMFAHPKSTYFGIGKIGRDQLADYASRKGWTMDEARRWLAPSLDEE